MLLKLMNLKVPQLKYLFEISQITHIHGNNINNHGTGTYAN